MTTVMSSIATQAGGARTTLDRAVVATVVIAASTLVGVWLRGARSEAAK
jgi:hypothetical protein